MTASMLSLRRNSCTDTMLPMPNAMRSCCGPVTLRSSLKGKVSGAVLASGAGASDAAERCCGARDRATDDGRPATGLLARVGQRLGEAHAHPGAERGRESDE